MGIEDVLGGQWVQLKAMNWLSKCSSMLVRRQAKPEAVVFLTGLVYLVAHSSLLISPEFREVGG